MADFQNFTFKNVSVIAGILELEGFADVDDVVSITSDAEQFTKTVGAKGDVTRVQTADNSCTIIVKLLQTSKSNAELNTLYLADVASGAGVFPLMVADIEGGERYVIPNAWIQKLPDITRGKGVNTMDWTFQGDYLTPIITG